MGIHHSLSHIVSSSQRTGFAVLVVTLIVLFLIYMYIWRRLYIRDLTRHINSDPEDSPVVDKKKNFTAQTELTLVHQSPQNIQLLHPVPEQQQSLQQQWQTRNHGYLFPGAPTTPGESVGYRGLTVAGVAFGASEEMRVLEVGTGAVHFKSCEELEDAGINQVFHELLLTAGLDLETLEMVSNHDRYFDALLKEAGIAKPGDRVKIWNTFRTKKNV